MSHISSSRMPHAYAEPTDEAETGVSAIVQRDAALVRGAVGKVSGGTWLLAALGIGVAAAAFYGAARSARPAPKKRRAATARKPAARKPAVRRAKAA